MRKLIVGENDLKSLFPEVARQASGWDPSLILPGSNKKLEWKCSRGHIWTAQPYERTGRDKTGCPYCSNKKVLAGFNDLLTRYPDFAKEADGWDPTEVMPGNNKKYSWRCAFGHTWSVSPNSRTNSGNGCPYCGNKRVWSGFNDLQTKYPSIAGEAHGWDPKKVIFSTKKKLNWLCPKGHSFKAAVGQRTGRDKTGCPYCSNSKVLAGFNDLQTIYPEIAAEAYDWDPSTVLPKSNKKRDWICPLGHIYTSAPVDRNRPQKGGCPYCAGKKVLVGFNDLNSLFPEIAREANGWDASQVTKFSDKKLSWICSEGHTWKAIVGNRTRNGTGCPECSITGFNPGNEAWFYLLERPGEQQFGITNFIDDRLKHHSKFGWHVVEILGPRDGKEIQKAEAFLKKWLRKEIGLVPGTTENWQISKLDVQSISELKKLSGLQTEAF